MATESCLLWLVWEGFCLCEVMVRPGLLFSSGIITLQHSTMPNPQRYHSLKGPGQVSRENWLRSEVVKLLKSVGYLVKKKEREVESLIKLCSQFRNKTTNCKEQCSQLVFNVLLNVQRVLMHLLRFMCRRCVGVLGMSPVFQDCDTGEDK